VVSRSLASAATAARQIELEDEGDFQVDRFETPEEPVSTTVPFQSLKGSVSHDTLKALTVRPFKFTEMSDVQERVLGLMPGLIGVKKRTGEPEVEGEEKIDSNKVGEKQDLLVKVS
jgi:ATP-dependent RNA helicase MSS116, mitochondrial